MISNRLTEEERNKKNIEEAALISASRMSVKNIPMLHEVINSSSEAMDYLKNDSVDLIVTSPPYYNAKDYSQWDDFDSYLTTMKKSFTECYRVLKPGRRFCLNISDIPVKGSSGVRWLPLGADLLKLCFSIGFELSDRILWFKTPLKGFQYGSLPYPPSPLINDSIEYIYILRKPGKSDYKYCSKQYKEASRLLRSEYVEYTKQIWSIRRVRKLENIDGHIAPFPLELPKRLIMMYSFVNDCVLDPFAGSGTTALAAMESKRNSIMYEINEVYANMIINRLNSESGLYMIDKISHYIP